MSIATLAVAGRQRPLGSGLVAMLAALFLFAAGCLPAVAASEPTFPPLTGRVVDAAGVLDPGTRAELTASLAALENTSTDQLVVVTVPSLQGYAIEDFANRLIRKWQLGQKGKDNGILLLVAPNEHQVRIEVLPGLEGTMTDALSSSIIQNRILPLFRRGDFAGGVRLGVRDINDSLLGNPAEVAQRAKGARRDQTAQSSWTDWLPVLIWGAIVLFILWSNYQQMKANAASPYGRRGGGGVIILPGGFGGSGNWGGGGWSSGGGGGGGFGGGGGGGFGSGGGASGSW